MSHVINISFTKFTLFKLKIQAFFSDLVKNFSKLFQMFISVCWVSNNMIANVEHTVNVMINICLNNFLEILKRIFGTKN